MLPARNGGSTTAGAVRVDGSTAGAVAVLSGVHWSPVVTVLVTGAEDPLDVIDRAPGTLAPRGAASHVDDRGRRLRRARVGCDRPQRRHAPPTPCATGGVRGVRMLGALDGERRMLGA